MSFNTFLFNRFGLTFINEQKIGNVGKVSIGRGVSDSSTRVVKNEHCPSLLFFFNQFWLKFMVRLGLKEETKIC